MYNKRIDELKAKTAAMARYIETGDFYGLSEREAREEREYAEEEMDRLFAAGYYGTEEARYVVA